MKTPSDVWQKVLAALEQKYTRLTIQTWFDDAVVQEFEDDCMVLTTSHEFKKDIILSKYLDAIRAALQDIFSTEISVLVFTQEDYAQYSCKKQQRGEPADDEYSFSTFVVGSSNKFAHAAAVAVAKKPAIAYNPLFIYGPSGLGKTHLLNAIMGEFRRERPQRQATYVSSEDFTNELIASISRGRMADFRDKYRKSDLLLIDDIQFIAGKESTQEEFFHTFNALHEARRQIVLTSDRTPKEIPKLEDRLKTRFEWGLLADISPPDYETRCAIVMTKARHLQLEISTEVVDFIAGKITNNVRQLEGVVKKMMALHAFMDEPLTVDTAQRALDDIFRQNPGLNPTPEYIIEHVATYYGLSGQDITGSKRGQEIMLARQVAIHLTRRMTKLSLPELGVKFGGRDHTTILHSLNRIEDLFKTSPGLRENIEKLMKTIRES